jgi:hypothetical protein
MLRLVVLAFLTTSVQAALVDKVEEASFMELSSAEQAKLDSQERGLFGVKINSVEYYRQMELPEVPVILSAARTGTHSLTQWLNQVGVPAVHDGLAPGAVSVGWMYTVPRKDLNNIRWLPARADRRLKEFTPEMAKVDQSKTHLAVKFSSLMQKKLFQTEEKPIFFQETVHVVREPLDHITSLANCLCSNSGNETQMRKWDDYSYKWAEHWVGNLGKGRVERAANYWLKWNELAGEKALDTFRIEDLDETKLVTSLGMQSKAKFPLDRFTNKVDVTPEEIKGPKLTWQKLKEKVGAELTEKIQKKAEQYGYKY